MVPPSQNIFRANMPGHLLQQQLASDELLSLSALSFADFMDAIKKRFGPTLMPKSFALQSLRKYNGLASIPGPSSDAFDHAEALLTIGVS